MVASQQGVVAVYQDSEGASLEVPSRLPEGLEHMTRMMDRCVGRTLQAQGSRKPFHLNLPGHYKEVRVLARSVVLNHHLTISKNLRFHFSVCAFLHLGATYPASYKFRL